MATDKFDSEPAPLCWNRRDQTGWKLGRLSGLRRQRNVIRSDAVHLVCGKCAVTHHVGKGCPPADLGTDRPCFGENDHEAMQVVVLPTNGAQDATGSHLVTRVLHCDGQDRMGRELNQHPVRLREDSPRRLLKHHDMPEVADPIFRVELDVG
jgi:hypothetical protein